MKVYVSYLVESTERKIIKLYILATPYRIVLNRIIKAGNDAILYGLFAYIPRGSKWFVGSFIRTTLKS